MTHTDQFGLGLSCASDAAASAYINGIDRLLSYQPDPIREIERAIELDPEFAMAHIARARIYQTQGRIPQAREAATHAQQLAEACSPREQQHIRIIALAVQSKAGDAFTLLREHTQSYPRDALPLSIALGAIGLFAFSGEPDSREQELAYLQTLAPHWGQHWWFDTFIGWALIETGEHHAGIELVERALQALPRNAQAAHARAHGHYECGEAEAGLKFIEQWVQTHGTDSVLYPHLRWHQGLFSMQSGDAGHAQRIYRDAIAPETSQAVPLLVLMDAASFAWRSVIYGKPLDAAQIDQVASQARECLPGAGPAFFIWHKALALASARDHAALNRLISDLQDQESAGRLLPGYGLIQFCQGLAAYARQDYAGAIKALVPASKLARRIGGSSAQQDVVTDTLIAANLRAGKPETAVTISTSRAARRASHLDHDWVQRVRHELHHADDAGYRARP